MMSATLIVYSTVDGHTLAICRHIAEILEKHGEETVLVEIGGAIEMDCRRFNKIVVGASIRYGSHRPVLYRFINRHRADLERAASAFFSVGAVARKPGKDTPEGNPYFAKFVRKGGWVPPLAAVFAGKIDYPKYSLLEKWIIRMIMHITHGPTDISGTFEFTDWAAVECFAEQIAAAEPTQI
ncbi:Protoporphyrinogen IX dehydrogenase [menaquinone] [Neisseria animaloris]|uniref:menaquinone-dependent protoporphyrinogen IX dehydrogenase n=1 Tax=Neisseria animaloris TaxID=326522 RepID=UPI000F714722|nr:menaquinone-dependent protoporphyrinogen IX dehydrogenase [Neisseria animaloris]VEH87522.1 Protoporphyrinogen IX dehydrogenase [menaquinone] [Neisseria animaloris]